jgi:hypothetical protein
MYASIVEMVDQERYLLIISETLKLLSMNLTSQHKFREQAAHDWYSQSLHMKRDLSRQVYFQLKHHKMY